MKGKTGNKFLAIVAVLILAILVAVPVINALPTRAANYAQSVAGPSDVTFKKYLVVPNNLSIPALTFDFTVTPGAAVTGTTSKMPVYAGDDSGKTNGAPTASSPIELQAAFAANAATTPGAADDGIANDVDKKYASVDVTIDLSGVTYSEPGIYRYVVTEENQAGANVSYDSQSIRTLDIYVYDNGNGELTLGGAVMYYGAPTDTADTTTVKPAKDSTIVEGNKCNSYVNEYPSHNLYVGKKVTGNQGSKDKYFRFQVTITPLAGTGSTVGVAGNYDTTAITEGVNGATEITDAVNGEYTNPSSITLANTGDPVIAVFYLQSDQYVNLMGIPTGATYEVAEADYSADGYTSTDSSTESFTITDSTNNATLTFDDPVSGTIGTEDIYTGYTNNKQGLIPTGVVLSVVPWVIAGVVIIGGVVFFTIRSKKKYDEQ